MVGNSLDIINLYMLSVNANLREFGPEENFCNQNIIYRMNQIWIMGTATFIKPQAKTEANNETYQTYKVRLNNFSNS